jgi:hypothetical protein
MLLFIPFDRESSYIFYLIHTIRALLVSNQKKKKKEERGKGHTTLHYGRKQRALLAVSEEKVPSLL